MPKDTHKFSLELPADLNRRLEKAALTVSARRGVKLCKKDLIVEALKSSLAKLEE